MFKILSALFLLVFSTTNFAQVLTPDRSVNWKIAGLRDTSTTSFTVIDMQTQGINGDGITPNDAVITTVFSQLANVGNVLVFPAGNFLFNNSIHIPGNVVIKGQGADATTFSFDLNGSGNAFNIEGTLGADTTLVTQAALKDAMTISVANTLFFDVGNWIQIIQQDADLVTSSWAIGSVGQIVQITAVGNNQLTLASPLRMNYDLSRTPYIRQINTVSNAGIECLKIVRIDDTAPQQSSNIRFTYATNCWVNGIESEKCTFSHIDATTCSNLSISKSYFHHAFDYGDGGRGYGVMLQSTTNECRIEDNVFEHLRHSMIIQSGGNGNVFAFNYSFDPYWPQNSPVPTNSAGDMVLHGNYTYSNLFEQNICQNIVIDNSHGPNGPYNTFFRNRASGFGIFFSESNSPNQNLIANEIPNTGFPYSLANYNILGTGHFIYGNNNKGTIDPVGTQVLADESYAYETKPDFTATNQWAAIGTPNVMGSGYNQAYERNLSGALFNNACGNSIVGIETAEMEEILVYPNPAQTVFTIKCGKQIEKIEVINALSEIVLSKSELGMEVKMNLGNQVSGIYIVKVYFAEGEVGLAKISLLK